MPFSFAISISIFPRSLFDSLALADKTTHKLALGGLLHAQERNAHGRKAPRVDFAERHLPVDPAC